VNTIGDWVVAVLTAVFIGQALAYLWLNFVVLRCMRRSDPERYARYQAMSKTKTKRKTDL
jgi:hypothetical protein